MILLLLTLTVTINSIDAKGNCQCKNHTEIRCKTNASAVDLCFSCQSTQTDCLDATTAYFHYPSICAAENLTTCCPDVTSVYVDNETLCSCYCPLVADGIQVLNSTPQFECNCGGTPITTNPRTQLTTLNYIIVSFSNTSMIVGITLGVCVPTVLLAAIIIGCIRYKNRLQSTRRTRFYDKPEYNDGSVSSQNSEEMGPVETTDRFRTDAFQDQSANRPGEIILEPNSATMNN